MAARVSFRISEETKMKGGAAPTYPSSRVARVSKCSQWQTKNETPLNEENATSHSAEDETATPLWPPTAVVTMDRYKATTCWAFLVLAMAGYVVYLGVGLHQKRSNPPVMMQVKKEAYNLPDVVFCPAAGDGCDAEDAEECVKKMQWHGSALSEGLIDDDGFFLVPTAPPTPAPTVDSNVPTSAPTTAFGNILAPSPTVAVPAIRVAFETTANNWCPRVNLSALRPDSEGIESGSVVSLHASLYLTWEDEVSSEPLPSLRKFINMFFIDEDVPIEDTVVPARLPYSRVEIEGSEAFTFVSNDVSVSMSQYVHLDSDGQTGSTERTYSQVMTSGEHTLRATDFDGETYEGALLYVTFNVNDFAYTSIEEVDPVDVAALLGSVSGMFEFVATLFGVFFVAVQASRPDRKWRFSRSGDQDGAKTWNCPRCCCFNCA